MLLGTAAWWNFLLGRSDHPATKIKTLSLRSPHRVLRRSSRFPLQRMKLQDKIKDFHPEAQVKAPRPPAPDGRAEVPTSAGPGT